MVLSDVCDTCLPIIVDSTLSPGDGGAEDLSCIVVILPVTDPHVKVHC